MARQALELLRVMAAKNLDLRCVIASSNVQNLPPR
jgi:hypothetical protein